MNTHDTELNSAIKVLNDMGVSTEIGWMPNHRTSYVIARVNSESYSVCYYPPPRFSDSWSIFSGSYPSRSKVIRQYDKCSATSVEQFFKTVSQPPKQMDITRAVGASYNKSKKNCDAKQLQLRFGGEVIATIRCEDIDMEKGYILIPVSSTEFKIFKEV